MSIAEASTEVKTGMWGCGFNGDWGNGSPSTGDDGQAGYGNPAGCGGGGAAGWIRINTSNATPAIDPMAIVSPDTTMAFISTGTIAFR